MTEDYILSFIYIDKFTIEKGEETISANKHVDSAIKLLVESKISSKSYSEIELKEELLKSYSPETVESVINNSNIDFNLEAYELAEQLFIENSEISKSEVEDILLNSGFTSTQIQYAINQFLEN